MAVEDRRFREHDGIDLRGVRAPSVNNVRAGGVREGASTITMQLARNAFLTESTRGWRTQAARGALHRPHRGGAEQGRDPRALPQHDLLRQRHLGRGGGEPRPARQGHRTGDRGRRRAAGRAAQGAVVVLTAPQSGACARRGATWCSACWWSADLMDRAGGRSAVRGRPVRVPARAWRPGLAGAHAGRWTWCAARSIRCRTAGVLAPTDARARSRRAHHVRRARAAGGRARAVRRRRARGPRAP